MELESCVTVNSNFKMDVILIHAIGVVWLAAAFPFDPPWRGWLVCYFVVLYYMHYTRGSRVLKLLRAWFLVFAVPEGLIVPDLTWIDSFLNEVTAVVTRWLLWFTYIRCNMSHCSMYPMVCWCIEKGGCGSESGCMGLGSLYCRRPPRALWSHRWRRASLSKGG